MTQEEFDKTNFGYGMKAVHGGYSYFVVSVNFREKLFGLSDVSADAESDDIFWVRCESVELIK